MTQSMNQEPRGTGKPSLGSYRPKVGIPFRNWIPVLVIGVPILLIIGYSLTAGHPAETMPEPTSALKPVLPTRTALPEPTDDLCTIELVRPEVGQVHALMLEFYDASALATQTPIEQLVQVIPSLQAIRRRAEALPVSYCLDKLRTFQISHMNMVINTLMAFMSKSDPSILREGIIQARMLNEEYKKEKARLLGEEYIPPPTPEPTPDGTVTVQPSATP
jgi:hypothetical protein